MKAAIELQNGMKISLEGEKGEVLEIIQKLKELEHEIPFMPNKPWYEPFQEDTFMPDEYRGWIF